MSCSNGAQDILNCCNAKKCICCNYMWCVYIYMVIHDRYIMVYLGIIVLCCIILLTEGFWGLIHCLDIEWMKRWYLYWMPVMFRICKHNLFIQCRAPLVINWCIPMNTILISIINHCYWNHVHQLSYRPGAPHCTNLCIFFRCNPELQPHTRRRGACSTWGFSQDVARPGEVLRECK